MDENLSQECKKALHVIKSDGSIEKAGKAILFALETIGWRWVSVLKFPLYLWFVEIGYSYFARHRRFFSRFVLRSQKRKR